MNKLAVRRVHGAPFQSNLHANLQRRLTLLNLRSPKAHHLDHQPLPHTGKIIMHLRIDTVHHQAEVCCMAQATQAAWHRDGPGALAAPAASRRGCTEWAHGTDATLVQSPEHGRMGDGGRRVVRGSGPCHTGCANETASGPRSLAGWGWDSIGGHDSDDVTSLWVVTQPFARGL